LQDVSAERSHSSPFQKVYYSTSAVLAPAVRSSGHLVAKTLNLDSDPNLTVLGSTSDFKIKLSKS